MDAGTLHVGVLILTVFGILYADHIGLAYIRGKRATVRARLVSFLHSYIWLGLIGMIVSGVFLVLPAWEFYLTNLSWYIKMTFVLVLIFNALVIGGLMKHASTMPFADLEDGQKQTLRVSGVLSVLGWVVSAAIGYFYL